MEQFTVTSEQMQSTYNCSQELGEGNFATVYEGIDQTTNTSCAIKIFKDEQPAVRDFQYANEIKIMTKLNHPNIIRLLNHFETSQTSSAQRKQKVIVIEKAQKHTLFDYIESGQTFDEGICRYYFKQLILALDYCHQQGIAHKDIKPENILFDEDFNLKITDFGLSESVNNKCNNLNGSSNYFSPQVHLKMDYYPQEVDLFASGILLFMMYQGNPPFGVARPNDPYYKLLLQNKLTYWIAHGQKWTEGAEKYSFDFRDLIKKMFAFRVEGRPTVKDIFEHPWMQEKTPDLHEVRQYMQQKASQLNQRHGN